LKKVAILQSNYIPWKGYFDIIASVDEFILYDDMQYTRRDWRNRNNIKTSKGLIWLTIPVDVKGKFEQRICDTLVSDTKWIKEHTASIVHNYSKARRFKDYKDWLFDIYEKVTHEKFLSRVNYILLQEVMKFLNIQTPLTWSMDYHAEGTKTNRLLDICLKANADIYLSGPAAKDYLEVDRFKENGILVEWMDYSGYSEYEQLYPPFEHGVSILDLILNCGNDARSYLKIAKKI
jgi:hypothetical protein